MPVTPDLSAVVAGIWARHRDAVLDQVAQLEDAVIAVLEGRLDDELREDARRHAHKVAGAGGTFGFPEASRLARELELVFQDGPCTRADGLALSDQVVALRAVLSGAPRPPDAPTPPEPTAPARDLPFLLLVEDDPDLGDRVVAEAAARGLRCALVADPQAARTLADREPPAAVLLSLTLSGGPRAVLDLLADLTVREPAVPVLVLGAGDDIGDRVEVARLGGRGFLQKPLPAATVVEAARDLVARVRSTEARILVVDDDPVVLAAVAARLSAEGMAVTACDDPRRFWQVLEETTPDLLVLDVEMPHLDGVELCRVVRNDLRWSELPVLFLTAHTEPQLVRRLFAAGADDYVNKPVVGPELATRIAGRLERVRLYRNLADTDTLTGVASRRKATQSLEQFLRLTARLGTPLCLAVLDLDGFKQVNDRHGHAVGDRVLRHLGALLQRGFRGEDVVARWGGEEFVVGLHGSSRRDGLARVARLLEEFRQEVFVAEDGTTFHVSFSAGVAQYPDDGKDLQALYGAADQALYQATAAGRDRVLAAGGDPQREAGARRTDVALVEDDDVLADLLVHALRSRGYNTVRHRDGREAADQLGGPRRDLVARVILLDIDLPGLDGLAVLRHLAGSGVLHRTRAIMLTARSAEVEVVQALALGAFDHVAKPFSVPVLLQRVRRALDA